MDLDVLNTAASALLSERMRMDTIAANIANSHTTRDANGQSNPYKKQTVNFQTILDEQNKVVGVRGVIEEDQSEAKRIYNPGHPDANDEGYVLYPNVSTEQEMVDMLSAKASYEANLKTIQVTKQMFNSALDI
jgi:flagellar basal-body rod protein FlgC